MVPMASPSLVVHPQEVIEFDEFVRTPGPAVALDGYVSGPTFYSKTLSHVSFNHHEGTDRYATRATCEQVALALAGRPGRFWREHPFSVHVNDADADVCLSYWLLNHPELVSAPLVVKLVHVEGCLDTSAGCLAPTLDPSDLDEVAWVFEPCFTGATPPSAENLRDTISEVCDRIDAFASGHTGRAKQVATYTLLGNVGKVAIVSNAGPLARAAMARDGIEVYVLVRDKDARHMSIGVTDPCVDVDMDGVYQLLNVLEHGQRDPDGRWGGASSVGGSPRASGTVLSSTVVAAVLDAHWR